MLLFISALGTASDLPDNPGYIPTIFKGADRARGKTSPKKRETNTSSRTPQFIPPTPTKTPRGRKRKNAEPQTTPTSASGRPIKSRRLHAQLYDTDCQPSADHDYIKTTTLHYVQSHVEQLQTQQDLDKLKFEAELDELKAKTVSLDTVKDFRMWTNFPNRKVFDSLSSYLKRRGGEQLKYWHGGATCQHRYYGDVGMTKPGPERKLSFMVVVKLKSGMNNVELAQLFGVSDTVIGHIVTTLINFLAMELKVLFEMPPLDDEGVAECFHQWENLMVILDCTELRSEKSTNLKARKQMFSNYKGMDTVKFAVSLGRNLCVNYVSKAYGGRASDKFITLDCDDMLKALPPGCKVMTDRGFNVGEYLNKLGVKLIIPNFKGRGRTQMTEKELNSSENIAMARIHVERIIQRIRTYHILEKTVKLSSKDLIEQMFTACAYLTNICSFQSLDNAFKVASPSS